ncbi:MAG: tetratricopeptide repeat protein [Planctomycetes bacterium]|nr:tetratricopeptide repeat protein [Planctomycetota bacterium]
MQDLTASQKADAFRTRGITYGGLGESERAIADYSAVIEMTEASGDQKGWALVNRGVSYGQLGESEMAIADYSTVIEMSETPVEGKARGLINRGFTYGQLGETEKEISDYSAVIEMTEAPVDQKATALVSRGLTYGQLGESEKAIADYSAVIKMTGVSSSIKTNALFSAPEAMIPIKPVNEAIAGIQRAFEEGDSEVSEYGGSPSEILKMILGRQHSSWSEFVEKLVPIYAQYNALTSLGSGITESITVLDAGGFSESQLDLWNSAWQKFGAENDELSIPLAALDASVEVIKTGKDRPLFDLPLEIRKIVQPLLKNSLSKN